MTIREATDHDIPAIVQLLKLSLGESLMPKSEAFWRWKHLENPFGRSPVLLAFEGQQLVGVRAFMRWEWKQGGKIHRAVRAVDTATHPHFHGKGIFRQLTQQLVQQCRKEGVDFIYNTPNKISMPGYLKMGWEQVDKLPILMQLHVFRKKGNLPVDLDNWEGLHDHPRLHSLEETAQLSTHRSAEYLRWRYRDNPLIKYHLVSSSSGNTFMLVYRLKPLKQMTEVRIVEWIGNPDYWNEAIHSLRSVVSGVKVITLSAAMEKKSTPPGFMKLPIGPMVTIRNLNLENHPARLNFQQWSPTLGDLELF